MASCNFEVHGGFWISVTQSPSTYQPPLASEHLSQALSLLLPHLSRWCSISIFTDTWALMHTALTLISPAISTLGAPLLESITLMRCNDFVSFGQHFQPRELKDSPLFSFDPTHSTLRRDQVLPRLRDLTLKGVHADWLSLPCPNASRPSSSLTAFIDGPYGNAPAWEEYENLVLVATSSGVSFMLSISIVILR